jgi:hypothetical protein
VSRVLECAFRSCGTAARLSEKLPPGLLVRADPELHACSVSFLAEKGKRER